MYSAVGCQCGMIFVPFGDFKRMVNGPDFVGSPSSTAILMPAGNTAGAAIHWMSPARIILASAIAGFLSRWNSCAAAPAESDSNRTHNRCFFMLPPGFESELRRAGARGLVGRILLL